MYEVVSGARTLEALFGSCHAGLKLQQSRKIDEVN